MHDPLTLRGTEFEQVLWVQVSNMKQAARPDPITLLHADVAEKARQILQASKIDDYSIVTLIYHDGKNPTHYTALQRAGTKAPAIYYWVYYNNPINESVLFDYQPTCGTPGQVEGWEELRLQ